MSPITACKNIKSVVVFLALDSLAAFMYKDRVADFMIHGMPLPVFGTSTPMALDQLHGRGKEVLIIFDTWL